MTDTVDPPLAGVRILDLAEGDFQMIGRYFADLGADVLRVEPPGGSRDRRDGVAAEGVSLTFEIANAGKRFITVDPAGATAREDLDALTADADIVLVDRRSDYVRSNFVDPALLVGSHPEQVVTVLSDFGELSSKKDWASTSDVQFALSTILSRSGLPDREEPLLPPAFLVSGAVAPQAVWMTVTAYYAARRTGTGDLIDFSTLDALVHIFDPPMGMQGSGRTGMDPFDVPHGRPDARALYPIFPTTDGMVRICVLSPRQWHAMLTWLGHPEELSSPEYDSPAYRVEHKDRIFAYYRDLFAGMTTAEAVRQGEELRVPTTSIDELSDVVAEPAFRANGSLRDVALADGRVATLPTGVYTVDGVRTGITGATPDPVPDGTWRAPRLADPLPAGRADTAGDDNPHDNGRLPFAGLRVLDFGVIVMGAETGRLLADYGADVIKIESTGFPDGCRQMSPGVEMTKSFAWGHRNKRSLGLDLTTDDGKALFRALVAEADVVLTNFKPGTLERLGFGYETLAEINPGIVLSESSAYGDTGPWSTKMGYGPLVRAASGLSALWRYPDDPDGFSDTITIYPDHVVGRLNAVAVVALLLRRARTGRGGVVSTAQVDAIFAAMAGHLAAESLEPGSGLAALCGPRDAPRGLFPAAGDDEWIIVDGHGDEHFAALAEVIGHPEWIGDDRFSTDAGRLAHNEELEDALREWASTRDAVTAERLLQDIGVPAGHMVRFADVADDHDFSEGGLLTTMTQPQFAEPFPTMAAEGRSLRLGDARSGPAPLQGEHTREVVRDVLGLDEATIDDLVARGVLEPHPSETTSTPTTGEPQ